MLMPRVHDSNVMNNRQEWCHSERESLVDENVFATTVPGSVSDA
jgi:hypothetical protein